MKTKNQIALFGELGLLLLTLSSLIGTCLMFAYNHQLFHSHECFGMVFKINGLLGFPAFLCLGFSFVVMLRTVGFKSSPAPRIGIAGALLMCGVVLCCIRNWTNNYVGVATTGLWVLWWLMFFVCGWALFKQIGGFVFVVGFGCWVLVFVIQAFFFLQTILFQFFDVHFLFDWNLPFLVVRTVALFAMSLSFWTLLKKDGILEGDKDYENGYVLTRFFAYSVFVVGLWACVFCLIMAMPSEDDRSWNGDFLFRALSFAIVNGLLGCFVLSQLKVRAALKTVTVDCKGVPACLVIFKCLMYIVMLLFAASFCWTISFLEDSYAYNNEILKNSAFAFTYSQALFEWGHSKEYLDVLLYLSLNLIVVSWYALGLAQLADLIGHNSSMAFSLKRSSPDDDKEIPPPESKIKINISKANPVIVKPVIKPRIPAKPVLSTPGPVGQPPAEPAPAAPAPVEQPPVEPATEAPAPVEPPSAEPASAAPASVEQPPVEPATEAPAPVEQPPADPTPGKNSPVQIARIAPIRKIRLVRLHPTPGKAGNEQGEPPKS